MKAKLNYKGKIIEIEDIKQVKGIGRFLGLMFRSSDTSSLLFEFKKDTKNAIHSLFCHDFLAIWLDENNKIIDFKLVNKIQISIAPKAKFRKLLEIPVNSRNSRVIEFFLLK